MTKKSNFSTSILSFNAMSAFSFDSVGGFVASWDRSARIKKIAEIIAKQKADVVALQEIHTWSALKTISRKLTSHPYIAYKKYLYGPRGGLVIFSRYPIEHTGYINFTKRGSLLNSSFIAHVIKNGVLFCKLKGKPVVILNTHVTPNLDHNHTKDNRFEKFITSQLNQIAGFVKYLTEKKNIVILAGDFNTAKNSYSYSKFLSTSKMQDIFSDRINPTQHQEYLPKGKKVKRIDFIFAKGIEDKPEILSTKEVLKEKYILKNKRLKYLSDHIALLANLKFS